MIVIPPNTNSSGGGGDVCQAVNELASTRAPLTPEFVTIQVTLAIIVAALYIGIIPVLYYFRKDPVFYRVRPFRVLSVYYVFFAAYVLVTLLAEAQVIQLTCGTFLTFHALGSILASTVVMGRTLLFVVETRYHQLLFTRMRDSASSRGSTLQSTQALGFLDAVWMATKLAYFLQPLDFVPLDHLANIRRHFVKLCVASTIPAFLIVLIAVAVIPIYHSIACYNCPIFVEFVVIVALAPLFQVMAMVRFVILARRLNLDEQGVLNEFAWLAYLVSPVCFVTFFILYLFDPGEAYFNREFNPQILNCIVGGLVQWIVSCALPIVRAYQFRRERSRILAKRASIAPLARNDFTKLMERDAQLKQAFYEFAASRYCMENLHFLDDLKHYKVECAMGLQTPQWMQAKAVKLIKTYIRPGSDQEINISSALRQNILQHGNLELLGKNQLASLFTRAEEEILDLLFTGVWLDFQNLRHQQWNQTIVPAVVEEEEEQGKA